MTVELNRRRFLTFTLAAPAIIRTPGLLMAVKPPREQGLVIVQVNVGQDGTFMWRQKSAEEILADVEAMLKGSWVNYRIQPEYRILSSEEYRLLSAA